MENKKVNSPTISSVRIRPMRKHDWPNVAAIYQDGMDTGIATFEVEVPSFNQWDQTHFAQGRWVAVNEAQMLGWAALAPVSAREVYKGVAEVSIYIHPAARGCGVGQHLLKAVIEQSESDGFWSLQASIFPENTASLHLFTSLGFRKIGRKERIAQRDGIWKDNMCLEKRKQYKRD